jgi:Lrp/AsnC family leucine-responsive transcriptional regulator
MRKLEERGVITGYHAVVDPKRLRVDITAFIRVMVDGSDRYADFVERAVALPEVQEVHSITGEGSHILKVRTANTTSLEKLLSTIQSWPGVHGTSSSIVLSSYKETRSIPVAPTALLEHAGNGS